MANSRLVWEYQQFQESETSENVCLVPQNEQLTTWEGNVSGPLDSPYEKGNFKVVVNVTSDYPFEVPRVSFKSNIWHPSVCPVTGKVGLQDWSHSKSLRDVLISIHSLLKCPEQFKTPMNIFAAQQIARCKNTFLCTARISTLYHAYEEEYPGGSNPYQAEHDRLTNSSAHLDPLELCQMWDPEPGASRMVSIPPGTAEYAFVAARFFESMHGAALTQVRRVENAGQLAAFKARAGAMAAACGAGWAPERMVRWLFHGTAAWRAGKR